VEVKGKLTSDAAPAICDVYYNGKYNAKQVIYVTS
jgi:hypothetical protein